MPKATTTSILEDKNANEREKYLNSNSLIQHISTNNNITQNLENGELNSEREISTANISERTKTENQNGYQNGATKRSYSDLSLDVTSATTATDDKGGGEIVAGPSVAGGSRRRKTSSSSCCSANSASQPPSKVGSSSKRSSCEGGTSSSSEDESMLESDEGFVYTYRGGPSTSNSVADLPDCFFVHLDDRVPNPNPRNEQDPFLAELNGANIENNIDRERREFSPEMDFLEMDFDPGPSENLDDNPEESPPDLGPRQDLMTEPPSVEEPCEEIVASDTINMPSTSTGITHPSICPFTRVYPTSDDESDISIDINHQSHTENNITCRQTSNELSTGLSNNEVSDELQSTDIIISIDSNEPLVDISLWTKEEVDKKHVYFKQASSCLNACVNALSCLNTPCTSLRLEPIDRHTPTNKCALLDFLIGKSRSYSSHKQVASALEKLSDSSVRARFFPSLPTKGVSHWLAHWLHMGIVPIVTMYHTGRKKGSWQHRCIYSVTNEGIWLTNPLECIAERQLVDKLSVGSMLMQIDRSDILANWNANDDDLTAFFHVTDPRWHELNVLGKCVNILREYFNKHEQKLGFNCTPHLSIPLECRAGITLVCHNNNPNLDIFNNYSRHFDDSQPESSTTTMDSKVIVLNCSRK